MTNEWNTRIYDTFTWTGGAGDNRWENPGNWRVTRATGEDRDQSTWLCETTEYDAVSFADVNYDTTITIGFNMRRGLRKLIPDANPRTVTLKLETPAEPIYGYVNGFVITDWFTFTDLENQERPSTLRISGGAFTISNANWVDCHKHAIQEGFTLQDCDEVFLELSRWETPWLLTKPARDIYMFNNVTVKGNFQLAGTITDLTGQNILNLVHEPIGENGMTIEPTDTLESGFKLSGRERNPEAPCIAMNLLAGALTFDNFRSRATVQHANNDTGSSIGFGIDPFTINGRLTIENGWFKLGGDSAFMEDGRIDNVILDGVTLSDDLGFPYTTDLPSENKIGPNGLRVAVGTCAHLYDSPAYRGKLTGGKMDIAGTLELETNGFDEYVDTVRFYVAPSGTLKVINLGNVYERCTTVIGGLETSAGAVLDLVAGWSDPNVPALTVNGDITVGGGELTITLPEDFDQPEPVKLISYTGNLTAGTRVTGVEGVTFVVSPDEKVITAYGKSGSGSNGGFWHGNVELPDGTTTTTVSATLSSLKVLTDSVLNLQHSIDTALLEIAQGKTLTLTGDGVLKWVAGQALLTVSPGNCLIRLIADAGYWYNLVVQVPNSNSGSWRRSAVRAAGANGLPLDRVTLTGFTEPATFDVDLSGIDLTTISNAELLKTIFGTNNSNNISCPLVYTAPDGTRLTFTQTGDVWSTDRTEPSGQRPGEGEQKPVGGAGGCAAGSAHGLAPMALIPLAFRTRVCQDKCVNYSNMRK